MSRFYSLNIVDVRRETADSVSVAFAVPADLKDTFRFEPGQYLTLRHTIDGESIRRPYSICSGRDDPHLRVGIKAVPQGRFSTFAQSLQPGDTLEVMPPQGHFQWLSSDDAEPRHHLGFAAGSGITPILSIARSILERRPHDTFSLVYGNKGQSSVMFVEALHDLKDRALARLRIMHVFSQEAMDVPVQEGHIDGEKVHALFEHQYFHPEHVDAAYICGPGEMNTAVGAALEAAGVPADRIRFERFAAAPRTGAPPKKAPPADDQAGAEVQAVIDGVHRRVLVRAEENVIAAAERQGVDLPYACAGGMCCTCRCKVTEGTVRMEVCYSLEPWELEAGFVLACQSHPTTERVVLDFDAR